MYVSNQWPFRFSYMEPRLYRDSHILIIAQFAQMLGPSAKETSRRARCNTQVSYRPTCSYNDLPVTITSLLIGCSNPSCKSRNQPISVRLRTLVPESTRRPTVWCLMRKSNIWPLTVFVKYMYITQRCQSDLGTLRQWSWVCVASASSVPTSYGSGLPNGIPGCAQPPTFFAHFRCSRYTLVAF